MGIGNEDQPFEHPALGETTLGRMFEESAERNAERPAQQYKGGIYDRSMTGVAYPELRDGEFGTLTYDEMATVVRRLAAGFRDIGLEEGDRVGLFADTRMEWAQSDFAVLAAGGVTSTVYKSSSESQVAYLLNDPGAAGVVVENETLLKRVYENDGDLDLDFHVVMDDDGRFGYHEDVYTLAEVYERGTEAFDEVEYQGWIDDRSLDDLASLVYTSGTTGKPKGVKLTHGNFRANVNQAFRRFGPRPETPPEKCVDESTRSVSFLPLAHVFERLSGHFMMFAAGATVAYAESVDTLKEDFQAVEPNVATSVPRVYEKMYAAIREQAQESSLKERIFEWAVGVSREYHRADDPGVLLTARYRLADKLVFSDVRQALGGNIDFMVSGGGTLSTELAALYHGMGLPIYEGYGLTEASPVVTANPPTDPKIGTIGPLVQGVDARLDPDIDAEFDVAGEVGELLVKGPNVTEGYWRKPEENAEAFTDGYFRTGDIVEERPDGYYVFHERTKQLIVLSTGKNIPPGPIEETFGDINLIEQVMVVGSDRKFVSALVVPDVDAIRWFAESEGVSVPDDPEAFHENEQVRRLVEQEIDRVNQHFEEHEQIKKFRLVSEEFTQENGLLTPTMKKKRRAIRQQYDEKIADMYDERAFEEMVADQE